MSNRSALRIGLLGASRIARGAVIEPAASMGDVEVTRVAASSADRARAYADEHGIPGVEDDYAALVASDAVDLVYNALPPSGHLQWSIAALEHGKHVLCEKPFAMNAGEAERMVAAADGSHGVLIEAFHYRFHPLFERVLDIMRGGMLGKVRHVSSHFDVAIPYRPGELRHTLEVGGGALMDLGCYSVHWARTLMQSEPQVVSAEAVQRREGVDESMRAVLDFDGVPADIGCSMAEDIPRARAELVIEGERGRLTVVNPLSPHNGHELVLELAGETTSETVDCNSTYWHQLRHVVDVVAGSAEPITGGSDAIANTQSVDAIYTAAGMRPRGAGT